ncbi:MAG: hypothetical protein ACFFE5_14625, partial [Candidatus Thorarchaeota archaeon]
MISAAAIQKQLKKYDLSQIQDLVTKPKNYVTLPYLSKKTQKPITLPIWTYFYGDKFYCFASGNSKKVKAIKAGNTTITLLIINKNFYPHLYSHKISFH